MSSPNSKDETSKLISSTINTLRALNSSKISFIVLILGIIFSALTIGVDVKTLDGKVNLIVVLLLFIATSEVFERSLQILKVEQTSIDNRLQLEAELRSRFNSKYLDGEDKIIAELDRLQQQDLDSELRIVIFGTPKSPPELTTRLVALMKQRKNITLRSILVLDKTKLNKAYFNEVDKRMEVYKDIQGRVKFFVLDARPPVGIDTYIIGTKHIAFNLSYPTGEGIFYKAIVIENEPTIVTEYISWFERELGSKIEELGEVREEIIKRGI